MDIRNMRQLMAIRAHGSLAKAAQALGVSQPSLSAAVTRMEDELRLALLERSSHGSRLTAAGEVIAERAVKVLAEADRMMRDAELMAGGEGGSVRLGVGSALRPVFVNPFAARLVEAFPALAIRFVVADRERLVPMVKAREIDLAICVVGDELEDEELLVTEVLTTKGVAVAYPGHELVGERGVSIERFAQFPAAGSTVPGYTNDAALGSGDKQMLLHYQATDYDPLVEIALMGAATLIAPAFVVQPYIDQGRLAQIDLGAEYRVSFAAIAHRAASYSPVMSRIVGLAAQLGAELQGRK